MSAITVDMTPDKYLVSIDRALMDQPTFKTFFDRLRLEMLATLMDTKEADLQQLSEEIKANWWDKNGSTILSRLAEHVPAK